MTAAVPVETTYADLREGEVIVDKSGNHWTAVEVAAMRPEQATLATAVGFWLADPATGVKMHSLIKERTDSVTVLRAPSRDDAGDEAAMDAATDLIAATLGGEVLAEESAEVEAQREAAEADPSKPMALPPFSEFTDLEKRSHLFLVHGVYAHDVRSRKRLDELHDEDHARSDRKDGHTFIAHTHDGEVPA